MTNWRTPSALSPALLAVIAIVGVGVLTVLLLILVNLFNGPAATPRPGASATPRPGASATAGPAASPTNGSTGGTDAPPSGPPLTAPPTPAGSLTPEQALVAHVPEAFRATCVVAPGTGLAQLVASCTADGGALTVTYLQFATAEDMAAAFANRLDQAQIEPNSGRCEDEVTWPAESEYGVGGQITGRRLCSHEQGTPTIVWTDDRLNILGQASAESASVERLIQFWTQESGPIP